MINTIISSRKTLTLRNNSTNLFDIDSISLLIGRNGTGKTKTLQEIARVFSPGRRQLSLDEPCKLILDSDRLATPEQLSEWGVVYYTPAQLRPDLRSTPNCINASKRPVENYNNLDRYSNILEAFGLSIELTATLRAEYKKTARLLAEALAKNRKFRTADAVNAFDFDNLDTRKRAFEGLSEFEASQSEYDKAEGHYTDALQALTELIQHKILESAEDVRVFACIAVVTQYVEKRKINISLVIGMIARFLELRFLPSLHMDAKEAEMRQLAEFTYHHIYQLGFEKTPGGSNHVQLYSRILSSPEDRENLELLPLAKICRLDYPSISSGQWAIMQQTIAIYESLKTLAERGKRKLLVLLDEGDAFLHLEWQRQYVFQINTFLSQCKRELGIECLQLILATHSPFLATDIPREFVETFDSDIPPPSFGAPMQLILNRSFGARSMGEFAIREINKTLDHASQGLVTERDRYIKGIIEDPVITREIDYLLNKAGQHAD